MPIIAELTGLWRRSLLSWPDGRRDTTTRVHWMQGPGLYADLRQPAERPDFRQVQCVRQLAPEHIEWLACQEGFAGELTHDGRHFEWRRDIDFQPSSARPDAGSLRLEGDFMIEEGRDVAYVEHWQRVSRPTEPVGALGLRDRESNRPAILVRLGSLFMFARARRASVSPGRTLLECVRAERRTEVAQELVDCEISFGRIESGTWRIEHSSLPFRERVSLNPCLTGKDPGLSVDDVGAGGESLVRSRIIERAEGSVPRIIGP